jgi:hypothetical protein
MNESELKAAIEQAQAKIDTHRNRANPPTHEERNKKLWASAMIDALSQLGIEVQPVPNGLAPLKPAVDPASAGALATAAPPAPASVLACVQTGKTVTAAAPPPRSH